MNDVELTNKNFLVYAMKAYNNPHCMDLEEFQEDLKRIKYIKRLLKKYVETGQLRTRLLINHVVVLYNVFGADATKRMLFFKIETDMLPALKTFLVFLNYMKDDEQTDIVLDQKIVKELREL
jgi:hypothetical protein